MSKFQTDPTTEVRPSYFERRRLRRIRMIVELTLNLIGGDDTVTHREARCLVTCARKAILELHPEFEFRYERIIRPHFECVLAERWPNERAIDESAFDMVN